MTDVGRKRFGICDLLRRKSAVLISFKVDVQEIVKVAAGLVSMMPTKRVRAAQFGHMRKRP